jgi:adenylate cyclase
VRVVRSFAFLDLCNFTDFADLNGDDKAMDAVTMLRSVVRVVAPRYGTRIDKWLGDGVMLVAVEPEGALLAAVAAVEEFRATTSPLRLRAGVAGGAVLLVEGDDYLGRPVNLAARLCGHARPNEVLADGEFFGVWPASLDAARVGPVTIRGFARAVQLLSVTGQRQTAPQAIEA